MFKRDADYNCNWIGGRAFAATLDIPQKAFTGNSSDATYVNITTDDDVVHGVVKSQGLYSFVRVYYSGHEVPFYQPLLALDMVNRTIHGLDIATGETKINASYITTGGTSTSDFQNGGDTVQTEVVPTSATYNTTTNMPNPYNSSDDNSTAQRLFMRDELFKLPASYEKRMRRRSKVAAKAAARRRRSAQLLKERP